MQAVLQRPSVRLASPIQKLTTLFIAVAMGLFLLQILMGMGTAHDVVEGSGFYGLPLRQWLPYAASCSWRLQSAPLWIATCWLVAGLYLSPASGGRNARSRPGHGSAAGHACGDHAELAERHLCCRTEATWCEATSWSQG